MLNKLKLKAKTGTGQEQDEDWAKDKGPKIKTKP